MTGQQKQQIRYLLDRVFERPLGRMALEHDEKVDDFIVELEKIWPKTLDIEKVLKDAGVTLKADPQGADRKARELPKSGGYNLIGGISENFHPEDH